LRYIRPLTIIIFIFGNLLFADSKAVSASHSAQRVIDVLEHRTFQRHLTTDIFNIARNGHLLSEDIKQKLIRLGFDFSGEIIVMKSAMMQYYYDTEHFRFHYDLDGFNAVDPTDIGPNNIPDGFPDYVNIMGNVFEDVYHHDIDELGYTPPPSDGGYGGSEAFDVFIVKTNAYGWTDYIFPAVGDNPKSSEIETNAYASYMKMNSSYDGTAFSHNTELENIQVTAAHEFFHAIQLGYDGDEFDENRWLMESTAVWMEEEHYDDVNDCYQYMLKWFENSHKRLTFNDIWHPYGTYIFFKYIDEHLGGKEIIHDVWKYSRNHDGLDNVKLALESSGYTFRQALTNMAIANCIMSSDASAGIYAYEEAEGYINHREVSYGDTVKIELALLDSVQFNKDDFLTVYSNRLLQPYASQYVRIETDDPVKVTLRKSDAGETPLNGVGLHSIVKTYSGNYSINSGTTLNIDPSTNTESIYVAIVSTEKNQNSVFNYQLNLSNGTANYIENFTILSYYPNPFNSATNIKIKVSTPQKIDINVYDLLGRKVKSISSKYLSDGTHEFKWDGTMESNAPASSGVYYITAKSERYQEWKKITLVK